ncbi:MAG: hypothetical protein A4E63_00751 [Syntrophorhabdus sp. PtaU1.Bin050]|nr:MAG: hypothetical protein A4E63_00751 [Syntrophorhabdus sp. PtaU1.Bin050]
MCSSLVSDMQRQYHRRLPAQIQRFSRKGRSDCFLHEGNSDPCVSLLPIFAQTEMPAYRFCTAILLPKGCVSVTGSSLGMSICVGISPQTRSLRSCGSIRSRSTSELLPDGKRPSFLVSRRFVWDTSTPCSHDVYWFVLSRKNFSRVAPEHS